MNIRQRARDRNRKDDGRCNGVEPTRQTRPIQSKSRRLDKSIRLERR